MIKSKIQVGIVCALTNTIDIGLTSIWTKFNENKDLTCQIADILKRWCDG